MRRLGQALGRDPMTLYGHPPQEAALRVAEIMLEQLKVDSADPDWPAQLRTVARDFRRLARDHRR